ncbi:hypothetical protein BC833DRAFT_616324 [Globomyces pollinis-pini]|nr:hypothetical protein BC833DRAFT_616324 [Globomyces pollinis-pini]
MTTNVDDFAVIPILLLGMSVKVNKNCLRVMQIPEIMLIIISYLDKADLATLARLSKLWMSLTAPTIYQHICFHGIDDDSKWWKLKCTLNPHDSFERQWLTSSKVMYLKRYFHYCWKNGLNSSIHLALEDFHALTSPDIQKKKRQSGCTNLNCQFVKHSARNSLHRTMMIPANYDPELHRFQGAAYYSIKQRLSESPLYQKYSLGQKACLQIPRHPSKHSWDMERTRIFGTHAPFIRSLVFSALTIDNDSLTKILKNAKNLSHLSIADCPFITDTSIKECVHFIGTQLIQVELSKLAITDSSMHSIARNCPNINFLNLAECFRITDYGIRDVLIMCPFLKSLSICRLGYGCGYAVTDKIGGYIQSFGSSLAYVSIAGCEVGSHTVKSMISSCPKITHWEVSLNQIGTHVSMILMQIINDWMSNKFLSIKLINQHKMSLSYGKTKKLTIVCNNKESVTQHFQYLESNKLNQ